MRILYLATAKEGNFHNHKFLISMVKSGYDVNLVSYHPQPVARNIQEIKGIKIYHYPPKLLKKSLFFNKVFHFKKVIKMIKPDILHSVNVTNVSFLAALTGFHPHLVMPMGSEILIYPAKNKLVKIINNFVFSKADWVTCDAEYVKSKIIIDYKYDKNKITVFPWGIELDMFQTSNSKNILREKLGWADKTIIVMNRHFEMVYDHVTMIKAFRLSIRENNGLRLLLIGGGYLKEKISELISEFKLDEYVFMTGRVSRDEMVLLLNESDIYLSTSISDGTSVSLLEAFACNKPVIVSDIPCNREWVKNGKNGYLANIRDEFDFSDAIIKLSKDLNLQKSMGKQNGIIARDKADWSKNFKKLELIYNTIFN